MKATSALIAIVLLLNGESASAAKLHPSTINDVQLKSKTRAQTIMEVNNKLFSELKQKIVAVQKDAAKGTPEGIKSADLDSSEMGEVVSKVEERWLGSIDKEEPEIADEFLR